MIPNLCNFLNTNPSVRSLASPNSLILLLRTLQPHHQTYGASLLHILAFPNCSRTWMRFAGRIARTSCNVRWVWVVAARSAARAPPTPRRTCAHFVRSRRRWRVPCAGRAEEHLGWIGETSEFQAKDDRPSSAARTLWGCRSAGKMHQKEVRSLAVQNG